MKKKILLCCSVLSILTGCASKSDSQPVNMTAHVNQEFCITLQGNATTGYKWIYEPQPDAGEKIALLKEDYTVSNKTPGLCGAPGQYIFSFQPRQKGKIPLHFRYSRPWEKKTDNDIHRCVVVEIK